MDINEIVKIILIFLDKISEENLMWRLGGTLNLMVQGMDVIASDIDIVTDKHCFPAFKKTLQEFFIKDGYDEKKKMYYALFKINNQEVEIVYYDDETIFKPDKICFELWNGLNMPVLPLPLAEQFYLRIGNDKKAKAIHEFLK